MEEIKQSVAQNESVSVKSTASGQAAGQGAAFAGASRVVSGDTASKGKGGSLDVGSLVLVAVLLAAGAILKLTLGSVLSFAGMKPNFIIAMYCLAILLVRPKLPQSLVIGLLAGCICQIPMLNSTPLLNIPSELLGSLAMGLLVYVPMKIGKVDANPAVATFLSTVVSGYTFALIMAASQGIGLVYALGAYALMVFGTATFNAILVSVLVVPLRKVLKR